LGQRETDNINGMLIISQWSRYLSILGIKEW
jgi:hypothetical protein